MWWVTCPANQRSSSPTPCFSDRLRWGMTRGSKHRYHRKYYKRITSNVVKGYEKSVSYTLFLHRKSDKRDGGEIVPIFSRAQWFKLQLIITARQCDDGLYTCEVQTLLKETKMAVCRKQQKARSRWKAHDATNSRMSWGRNAARPSHWLHLLSVQTKDKITELRQT